MTHHLRLPPWKNELILENLKEKRGDLGDGQRLSEVGNKVENDFQITNNVEKLELIKQMEKETCTKKEDSPVTNSTFNEVRDYESKIQDGRGGGKPFYCSNREEGKTDE